eukprot:6199177-Prymnesium_polylepis.1
MSSRTVSCVRSAPSPLRPRLPPLRVIPPGSNSLTTGLSSAHALLEQSCSGDLSPLGWQAGRPATRSQTLRWQPVNGRKASCLSG